MTTTKIESSELLQKAPVNQQQVWYNVISFQIWMYKYVHLLVTHRYDSRVASTEYIRFIRFSGIRET